MRQPWASLLAAGVKRIETRDWHPRHVGPLAIHASSWRPGPRQVEDSDSEACAACAAELLCHLFPGDPVGRMTIAQRRELLLRLPFGAVLATARLVDTLSIDGLGPSPILRDTRGRPVREVSADEETLGNYYGTGRLAWILDGIERLPVPAPAKGAQGLWDWRQVRP